MAKPKGDGGPTIEQMVLMMPPSGYQHDADIAAVVERVIAGNPESLGFLTNARIVSLRRTSKRSEDAFTVDGAGGSFIRSDRERGISGIADLGVWFRGKWWDALTPADRSAWVWHQLRHFSQRPKGEGIVRVGHDVEAFAEEALLFGAWETQLELFGRNMAAHANLGRPSKGLRSVPPPPPATAAGDVVN